MTENKPMRLQRYLALCGVASRRKSEELIQDGRVLVNGTVVTTLGTKVNLEDTVSFDGAVVVPESRSVYVALNKPRGYLCSSSDPDGRPLAIDLLTEHYSERLYSVGRLDFNTSGLILFTNDGEFTRIVSHPSSEIEKEYLVESFDPISENDLEEFKAGVFIEGVLYAIQDYVFHTPNRVRLILIEGKNREIRRLYEAKNIDIRRIHRIRVGNVQLGDLENGAHRPLKRPEIDWFYHAPDSKDPRQR